MLAEQGRFCESGVDYKEEDENKWYGETQRSWHGEQLRLRISFLTGNHTRTFDVVGGARPLKTLRSVGPLGLNFVMALPEPRKQIDAASPRFSEAGIQGGRQRLVRTVASGDARCCVRLSPQWFDVASVDDRKLCVGRSHIRRGDFGVGRGEVCVSQSSPDGDKGPWRRVFYRRGPGFLRKAPRQHAFCATVWILRNLDLEAQRSPQSPARRILCHSGKVAGLLQACLLRPTIPRRNHGGV